jgi:HEAT repeat protein
MAQLENMLHDKQVKAKAKVESIAQMLLANTISIKDLLKVAKASKDPEKATCIEAIEFATKSKPAIATSACLAFVAEALTAKAPRVKWESAKVIGNIAPLFPGKLDDAIKNLLINTEYSGTVVRWSAAYALGEILKLKTKRNKDLVPAIEAICKQEQTNSIRKIYLAAMKKLTA